MSAHKGTDASAATAALALGVQMAIPGIEVRTVKLPKAATLQLVTDERDAKLTAVARANNNRVLWWWGVRKIDGLTGAVCYVCGQPIATWSHRFAMTEQAKRAVHDHRMSHWRDVIGVEVQP